jgi:phosphohistidine swiveling domain-containing protein
VVAKIEKFEAIDAIDAILPLCDGVMVARGDLGVEMPAEEVPLLQKELIRKANSLGIPVITATQMLDSMASSPRPTRAEVSDVANAILDGTDAVMLSNESAVGDYPVEAVATMDQIARRIERDYPQRVLDSHMATTIPNAICQAVSNIGRQLNAAAILPLTKTGSTARNVSKFRPSTPILAITSEVKVARQLQLVWGVNPLLVQEESTSNSTFSLAMAVAQEKGPAQGRGSGGPDRRHPLRGERLHRSGQGGCRVRRAGTGHRHRQRLGERQGAPGRSAEEAARLQNDEILVVRETTVAFLEAFRNARGVIAEEEGRDSHAAVIGERLGVPVIVGVANATEELRHGEIVTLQVDEGVVHRGSRNLSGHGQRRQGVGRQLPRHHGHGFEASSHRNGGDGLPHPAGEPLRSVLTMLGIVIGNASVITLVGVGRGASNLAESQLNTLGANVLFVVPGTNNARREGIRPPKTLVIEDAEAIAEQVPSVRRVAPQITLSEVVQVGGSSSTASISGVTPEFLGVRRFEVAQGRFFSARRSGGGPQGGGDRPRPAHQTHAHRGRDRPSAAHP